MSYEIVKMLHTSEAGGSEQKKNEGKKQLSWIHLVFVMIFGIVVGRLSVGGCNGK